MGSVGGVGGGTIFLGIRSEENQANGADFSSTLHGESNQGCSL